MRIKNFEPKIKKIKNKWNDKKKYFLDNDGEGDSTSVIHQSLQSLQPKEFYDSQTKEDRQNPQDISRVNSQSDQVSDLIIWAVITWRYTSQGSKAWESGGLKSPND